MSDRLTIDVDCGSYGSSECPSMASSFSPLDSPTPTPTTIYSQGSLASPGWPDGQSSFPGHHFETAHATTPLRSSFRLAEMTSDGMQLPYGNMDGNFDYLPGYADSGEQLWIQSDMPKGYDNGNTFPYQAPMPQYNHMARNYYHGSQRGYLPESVSNPCLSRPIFHQPERLSSSMSMNSIPQWMPSADAISPQTITPSQAFPEAPVTPPPSYSAFPASIHSLRTHTPTTPIRSSPMTTASSSGTPMTRVSCGNEYMEDDFNLSPGMRESLRQRQLQRRTSKKSVNKKPVPKQSLKLENLPSIIKQVQFRCKEPGCKGRFKRQEHLKRHMKSHSKEKPHVCWVPGCNRGFSRSDNLNAHYTKTHSKRGGRNRYVATLDETSPDYDPDFRGQLTPDGRPIYGSKLDDPIPQAQETDIDSWDD
ncbi:C2H2 type conidiation transcription factor BrlA [Paecilomyces variotii No. 5]|uniref:C2H2 type master regulator of conidiophore development brlA n=1 Tax=Byssochlamys spectabilis (strain No. 5 / NBRC 109023) TaxID=1356009 RepID=V5G6P3_BYSSN|nr:C2H2 type conidiation transcription factor BrlA [Paecilomyces variotii No. 5]